jgi:hypothetical protein
LAASTASVRGPSPQPAVRAAASFTARLETTRPVKERATNGRTWRPQARRPAWAQTQRRLSSNEGTVPTAVAATLAAPPREWRTPTTTPSTARLVAVETPETAE